MEKVIPGLNVAVLRVPEGAADRIAAALERTGLFTFIEPDYLGRQTLDPNDPSYPSQWHMAKIQAAEGWGLTTGSTSVPVAVIDSGVDIAHPEFTGKLLPGWNFPAGNSNIADVNGHGTATAGTAAAGTNNGTGVAGVAWSNPILPLLVTDSTGWATYSDIASAISYAADHGARVISISIAGTTSSSTLQSAVDYAWSKGAVVAASAGNSASSSPMYPAGCDKVISVGATDGNDLLASFSNYGSWVDVFAPGVSVLTTSIGGYGYWSGTSFSAPIVAGVLALMVSENPGISATSLSSMISQSADNVNGYLRVNAYKALLAAKSAPVGDTTAPVVTISSPGDGSSVAGTVTVQGTAGDNVGVTTVQFLVDGQQVASSSSGNFSFSWNSLNAANGSHTLAVRALDAANNAGTASVGVTVANAAPVADTQPPTVSITSPTAGSRVGTSVKISVSAKDNVGVTQVAVYVDKVLACSLTAAPYNCNWNSKKAASGTHTISATAWDAAQNFASASVSVTK